MNSPTLPPIPYPLRWQQPALDWSVDDGRLSVTAGAQTDLFIAPLGNKALHNAPRLLFEPEGDFLLSARVTVDFENTFDAGVLLLYQSETSWAKLCFEYSPQRDPMIVSVVTRGISDDCNSAFIDGNDIYLRIARISQAFAFHHSSDGRRWHMVRVFRLDEAETAVGFLAQAPTGDRCTVTFSEITFTAATLQDIRSGV
jgi:regulation of enolase protein 1 (concanavalin A-like superfamily)